ncbi:transglutaminase family protein [Nakamurella deserti]|uniref:transglutaminase family protein n=1 Tax=Nakamurella deserti TaxID=2164074 RepID=UPI000DBE66CA|nr:transglutaminase family protein [Nakamurella deserti]
MTAADRVRRYAIEHRTTYSYSDDVSASYGRGHLRPRDLAWQRCLEHEVVTSPAAADASHGEDVYGNRDFFFHVTAAHRTLEVVSRSLVEVRTPRPDPAALALPWEQARPRHAGEPDAVDFVVDSPRIDRPDAVGDYARPSFPPGRGIRAAVVDLTHRIFADFTYRSGSTTVTTGVAEVLARRQGVCQDFAHLAVACLRSQGLAGRYVSGYLATQPPPGKERMIGVDATHAWAAVWLPGGDWLAFDPTNDQLVDERYTTVAWGRDYGDVPPLKGVIFTDATTSSMKVQVDVAPVGIAESGDGGSRPLPG